MPEFSETFWDLLMSTEIEIDHLRAWIGNQEQASDIITPELLKRFRATLGGYTPLTTKSGSQRPLGIHWCLALPAVTGRDLGEDGHPAKGGFLPPVPLPRRMWASSQIRFHRSPCIGAPIKRTSTIRDVVLKHSRESGPLVFVHVDHEFEQDLDVLIQDQQTIVYRQPSVFKQALPQGPKNSVHSSEIHPDSTLLFRYSALTFNGHRIHYDNNYATNEEGYPGLVVHGPLMATLLMNLAQASQPSNPLREFTFRGVAPAFVDQALHLVTNDDGAEALEVRNHEGALIMSATAQFGNCDDN
jgi:3-methylfumaryl-CoA hydratase